jgi:N-acetylglutamate synthase-like GNAT family acetyltransferase
MDLPSDQIDTVDNDGLPALRGDLDEELCTDIDEMHIRRALRKADIIIAFYKVDESEEICLGFLLAEFIDSETLYISLVCASPRSGVGTRLIRIIKRIAFENKIKALVLDTVKSAKKFYSRRKFIETPTPTIPERMTYNMSTYAIAESRPRKTKGGRKLKRHSSSTRRR